MLKYETIQVSAQANREGKGTILSIAAGKKVTLKGLGYNIYGDAIVFLEIEGNRLIRTFNAFSAGYGNFIPLNLEVQGPVNIDVGIENISTNSETKYLTIMYEE